MEFVAPTHSSLIIEGNNGGTADADVRISYQGSNGCSIEEVITVKPRPVTSIGIGDLQLNDNGELDICSGSLITLNTVSTSPLSNISWAKPSGAQLVGGNMTSVSFEPITTGIYTLNATASASGCSSEQAEIQINVNTPTPFNVIALYRGNTVDITDDELVVCSNEAVDLDISPSTFSDDVAEELPILPRGSAK